MIEIDTEIRHVTKAGANLFEDLGFSAEEAGILDRESRRQVRETVLLKEQLMGELTSWMKENHLKQQEAATLLRVTRPRVSDVVNKKTSKFTLDALVGMLALAGRRVTIRVG
jgi:predicted XRE-type DNA-binding protein